MKRETVQLGREFHDVIRGGNELAGPVVIDEGTATTVVMSDQVVQVDRYGQLLIRREES